MRRIHFVFGVGCIVSTRFRTQNATYDTVSVYRCYETQSYTHTHRQAINKIVMPFGRIIAALRSALLRQTKLHSNYLQGVTARFPLLPEPAQAFARLLGER